jgi:hypothetical protein
LKNIEVNKNEPIGVLVKLDGIDPYGNDRSHWEARLYEKRGYYDKQVLTQWKPVDRIYAEFDIDFIKTNRKNVSLFAEIRNTADHERIITTTQGKYLYLHDPTPIAVKLKKYEVKKNTHIFLELSDRIEDIGDIAWFAEINRNGWNKIESLDKENRLRLDYNFEPGKHRVRAKVYNKISGQVFETDYLELSVFYEPKVILTAPSYALVGDEIKVSAVSSYLGEPVLPTELRYEWSLDNSDTWIAGNSTKFITAREPGQMEVAVRVRFIDPPMQGVDKRRYAESETMINFKKPRKVLVELIGPSRVEEGKSYEYRAIIVPPYPDMVNGISGYFTLPNGTVMYGTKTTYVAKYKDLDPKTNMMKVKYKAWVNGFQERTETEKVIEPKFWQYDWPEFKFKVHKTYDYSPTNLSLIATHNGDENQLEKLEYEWNIPHDNIEIIDKSRPHLRIIKVSKAGTYTFSYTVKDTRDNTSTREAIVTVKEPSKIKLNPEITYSNERHREPLILKIKYQISGGHPLDKVADTEYRVDGGKRPIQQKGTDAEIKLNAGEHMIYLKVKTAMGYLAGVKIPVRVKKNIPPVCKGGMKNYLNHFVYTSNCADKDGEVTDRIWFVDGKKVKKTGKILSLSKLTYEKPPIVELIGVDDSGAKSKKIELR